MKVWPLSRFWALRPQVTARRLELGCWICGVVLTAALLAPVTSATASAPAPPHAGVTDLQPIESTSMVTSLAAYYQARCVRRVIAMATYWPSLDVGRQIDHQCFATRTRAASSGKPAGATLACATGVVWPPTVRPTRPPGCAAD